MRNLFIKRVLKDPNYQRYGERRHVTRTWFVETRCKLHKGYRAAEQYTICTNEQEILKAMFLLRLMNFEPPHYTEYGVYKLIESHNYNTLKTIVI